MKDESDMMRVEEEMVASAMKNVADNCEKELKTLGINVTIPKRPFPELSFPKIYEILEEMGKKIKFGEDYDRESEELLSKHVAEKYKSDFFFINRFPSKVKPFYVMKVDEEPQWARSVDLIYRGMEQSSGGQREHRYEKIMQQVKEKKLDPETVKWFTEVFKYGVPPHGGFCLGLERFTMQLLNLKNIKEAVLFSRYPGRIQP
jgi:aspartyl-tRNA synthetase